MGVKLKISHHKLMNSSSTSPNMNYDDNHESRVVTVVNIGQFVSLIEEACWAYMKKFN